MSSSAVDKSLVIDGAGCYHVLTSHQCFICNLPIVLHCCLTEWDCSVVPVLLVLTGVSILVAANARKMWHNPFMEQYASWARQARDSMARWRRSSVGWIPTKTKRLSVGAGRRHLVSMCKASLIGISMRRVWALWHQTGAQYPAVEWTKARVAVRNIVALAPQLAPDSRLKSLTRFITSWAVIANVDETWVQLYGELSWFGTKSYGLPFDRRFKLTCHFVVKVEGCRHCFGFTELELSSLEISR